ncbi:Aryl-alcohol dehydrogenase [Cyphellophora attinorum]|uniref:Aryl-alcohol dehydrogenase n=1 Tax=Cyphellophora attinorum TaxID=1664694 RepID=A0A0N0NNV3_9EURO|nr:Aryl-alcohol dehydrogenase [Phialophora attinorum]KPI42021.1 Aryl-alcohol dehydrogenase [Phialophora attinorum]
MATSPNEPFSAIICHPPTFTASGVPTPSWKFASKTLTLPRSPAPKELQIRVLATGICHTDLVVSSAPPPYANYPVVLGHEGAGIVEAVGEGVTVAKPGDKVLLSYSYCDACELCKYGKSKAWCEEFSPQNVAPIEGMFQNGEEKVRGKYFGQSSFAARTLVNEVSVVNVSRMVETEEELKLLAPLGCGIMTGAGNMQNVLKVGERDVVLVTGLGGVGLGGVMAAKARGAKAIVVVDRVKSRLELAKELGATHKIKEVTAGLRIAYALETSGVTKIAEQAVLAVGHRGHVAVVGVAPPTESVSLPNAEMMRRSKTLSNNVLGDSNAADMVPLLIRWWREGKLPLEKLVKFFKAEDFEAVLHGMHDGSVIKPVLVW